MGRAGGGVMGMREWRIATCAFSLGQVNEALWLNQPIRALLLLVLSAAVIGLVELGRYLRRHVRWAERAA